MPAERLTLDEIEFIVEAIGSHVYWEMSDEDERHSGYSTSEKPDVKKAEALQSRLEQLSNATPKPFLLSFDGRVSIGLSRIIQFAANTMRQLSEEARSNAVHDQITWADAIADALRDGKPLPDVPESVVPAIKPRTRKAG